MNKTNRYLLLSGLLLAIANIHGMGERSQLINNNDDISDANSCTECCAKICCFTCLTMQAYEHERDEREADHKISMAKKKKELEDIKQTIPASTANTADDDTHNSTFCCCGPLDPASMAIDYKIKYSKRMRQLGFTEDITQLHRKISSGELLRMDNNIFVNQWNEPYQHWSIDPKLYVPIEGNNNNNK
jgi:hypothetical protein